MSTYQQLNGKNQWICQTEDMDAPGAIEAPDPGINDSTHVATAQFDGDTFTGWKIQTHQEYADDQEAIRQQREEELEPQRRRSEIKYRLREIDIEAIRPLRATERARLKGLAVPQIEIDRIDELEAEAQTLRDELATLQAAE